ncbi:hypothetical protein FQZ97_639850 [compost metagenome]
MLAGEVLQDRHGWRHQAHLWRRYLAGQPRRRRPAEPHDPAGDERQGLSQPDRTDFPRLVRRPEQWPGDHPAGVGEGGRRRPDRSVRRQGRGDWHGAAQWRPGRCRSPAGRMAGRLPRALLPGAAAHRAGQRRGARACRRRPGRPLRGASGGYQRCALHQAGRFRSPRNPRLHRRGPRPRRSAPAAQFLRPAVPQVPRGNGRAVRRHSRGAGEHRRDRQALQHRGATGQALPARLPDAQRHEHRRLPAPRLLRGPGRTPGRALAEGNHARLRREAPALHRPPGVRARHHHPDGLPRLLPDRCRLHPVGQEQRRAGGTGPGLGCRLPGGLRAEDHRPRPAGLRPAVRTLPQPRAGLHARLRRRLLHGRPRPGDRLRGRQVRAQRGEPDHHLRLHGGQGGGARRGAGAGQVLRPGRQAVEDDPLRSRHDPGQGLRAGGNAPRLPQVRRGSPGNLGHGPEAGRHHPRYRQARRWRGDRTDQADRLRADRL